MPKASRWRPGWPDAAATIVIITVMALSGCASTPSRRAGESPPPASNLYIDWDHHDWCFDRYILTNVRDVRRRTEPTVASPSLAYRDAVTYRADWDSLGLVSFLGREPAEQQARRRDGARAHLEARRLILRTLGAYQGFIDRGSGKSIVGLDAAPSVLGSEATVTAAITALVAATGTDPSSPFAWRDLAYFCGAVGDRPRQQRALAACLAALDQADGALINGDDAQRLRRDVLLDLAWLARDLGQPAVTLAYIDYLEPWLAAPGPEQKERRYEAQLLRGLALADQGEWLAAVSAARDLPRLRVATRSLTGGSARESLRWSLNAPHFMTLGFDRTSWPRQRSDFGRRWIKALAGAPAGESAHVLWLLGPPPTHLELPARLASRFWQDLGRLHAEAGQRAEAAHCYEWAALYRPYGVFFPLQTRTGRPRGGSPVYYLGYDTFFLCGDRQAYQRDIDDQVAERSRSDLNGN